MLFDALRPTMRRVLARLRDRRLGVADDGDAAAVLRRLGAIPVDLDLMRCDPGRGELAGLRIPPWPGEAALFGFVVRFRGTVGSVILRLTGADGGQIDEVVCPARAEMWETALFARAMPQRLVALALSPDAALEIIAARLYRFPATALDPQLLMPRVSLAPDASWSRVYGTPQADDVAGRLREAVFNGLARPALVTLHHGLSAWLEPGDELSRALLLSGLYEPETMLVVQSLLPPGGVFVDVGAHCGAFSLFAAALVGTQGTVLAFEPSPREFARLEANIAANRLTQVMAHPAAIAEAPGTVELRLAEPGHAGHNTIGTGFAYAGVTQAGIVQVQATTLDIALAGLARCDLIKMDVEGAELRALQGGTATLARLRPALILEVFDQALAGHAASVEALLAWLDAHDYVPHDIHPSTGALAGKARISPGESKNIVALPRQNQRKEAVLF